MRAVSGILEIVGKSRPGDSAHDNLNFTKTVLDANGLMVDEAASQTSKPGEQMIVKGHATRYEGQRCPICGRMRR